MRKRIFLIAGLLIHLTQPAYAYIDPGSGSVILSVIIGFFVAIGILFKTFWYKLKSVFSFLKMKIEFLYP